MYSSNSYHCEIHCACVALTETEQIQ